MTVTPVELIYWVGMAAVAVNAMTAVLETEDKGMDVVGAVMVGLAASLGGGTVRDLLLNREVFWLGDQGYLSCGLVTVAITFVVARWIRFSKGAFLIPDAIGLALFTVVGARIAVALGTPWLAASLMGVVTGVFGGVARDVLVNEIPLIMQPGMLYATASWSGALTYIGLLHLGVGEGMAMGLGGLVIFGMRFAAIRYKLKLPAFRSRKPVK